MLFLQNKKVQYLFVFYACFKNISIFIQCKIKQIIKVLQYLYILFISIYIYQSINQLIIQEINQLIIYIKIQSMNQINQNKKAAIANKSIIL